MTIGLIDVDGHNYPNLALMKLAAHHKAQGDTVEWYQQDCHYDLVYQSKVFDETYTPDIAFTPQADTVIKGGTGYGLENKLPEPVEHIMPDYGLYNIPALWLPPNATILSIISPVFLSVTKLATCTASIRIFALGR